ncbi:MAG TPA: ATP-binding protein [Opitutaceae bacterium]|nr:ATP-binding protein [Opitutaceae bacterium]
MSIKTRFTLLLGLMLLGFLAAWLVLRKVEQNETRQLLARAQADRVRILNHWIDFSARILPQLAAEYAESPELASSLAQPVSPELRSRLLAELAKTGVSALWWIGADGTPKLHLSTQENESALPLPFAAGELVRMTASESRARFFREANNTLLEIFVHQIGTANMASAGWLVIAQPWNEAYLAKLSSITDAAVSLVAPANEGAAQNAISPTTILRPLKDDQGRTLRVLRAEYPDEEFRHASQANSRVMAVFIGFGLLIVAALTLALQQWVLRPLDRIGMSLAQHDVSVLGTLAKQKNELGRIAELVEFSAAQTAALRHNEEVLRRTMEERARLGWDLHDGVIQTLYAAGMGLAGVRSLLQPDQHLATGRLEQVRGILNETIRDIRNFISGLEPEALQQQSFAQAVNTLLKTMQSIRPLRTLVEIDDTFAKSLSLPQRVHALQIVREAVSNALRHGEAGHVSVTLRAHDGTAEFEIKDNGRGFDTAALTHGHGLGNLAERARELGAELVVESTPGKGTRVKLIFPLRST